MPLKPGMLVLIFVLLAYWGVSLHNLSIVPPVYEDEPWQASTGWKLATQGIFGTDLFTGFYGMERHYYGYMPVHPLILAGLFRFAGVGLLQARFEPVALGFLVLILTYGLAVRLWGDERIGLLAVLFLVLVRLTGTTRSQVSGILFLDVTRIARYDMAVPVFGLAAMHVYLSAQRRRDRGRWYLLAGLLAGLSGLAHLYGVFWLPVLLVLAWWDSRDKGRANHLSRVVACLIIGFLLLWLPYIGYVWSGRDDWRGQTQVYSERFELFDLSWYWGNLLKEPRRYGPGLGPWGPGWPLRPGFWVTLVAMPLFLVGLARQAIIRADRAARAILVPTIVLPVLFALLIHLKLANYLATILPLMALVVAWGTVCAWDWLGRGQDAQWGRPVLATFLLLVGLEGISRLAVLEAAARVTTPYYTYINQVKAYIPPGARVLALHQFWFGLEDHEFRSFGAAVLAGSFPAPGERGEVAFVNVLEQAAPDIVLLDAQMRENFAATDRQSQDIAVAFEAWLSRHRAKLIGQVPDLTYGLMEIYGLDNTFAGNAAH